MCWRRPEVLEPLDLQALRDRPDQPVRRAQPDPKEQRAPLDHREQQDRPVRQDRPERRDRRGRPELLDPPVQRALPGQLVRGE
jgi:hypothetical protein